MLPERLVEKLTGQGLDDLVLQLHDARARVFEAAERAKADPQAKGALEEAKAAHAKAKAALKKAEAEHQGLVALTNLLAAMTQGGEDANQLLLAVARLLVDDEPAQQEPAQKPAPAQEPAPAQTEPVPAPAPAGQNQADDTETGTFTVLETRASKSPGTVRAYCQAVNSDQKVAIYAKNGSGQALAFLA